MTDQEARKPKPATDTTRRKLSSVMVDFDDPTDFAAARRGLVAEHPSGRIEEDGRKVWDVAESDFIRDTEQPPDTVHPGLWRQARLNAIHGLFEVADGVWQARGYDISNVTFMATKRGWLVIDPLTTEATAAACLDLANTTLGARPVVGVIYTHSHVDHYAGVRGVTTDEAVAAGDVRIIAPDGFMREAVGENVTAGPIMQRRALYQFGPLLPPGPQGHVDCGLGMAMPIGMGGLIPPTETITETGEELDIDGLRVVFQNTPEAEAPAEMNFFFPDHGLLCMAENCTHTLHNLYPIRGAQIRDAYAWSNYIQEALLLWGDRTDTMFASHHWPRFGRDDVSGFLRLQRDVYRWMHDQTLRLANRGHTPDEIADRLEMPDCFRVQSHVQGYYGTVSHNVRSVYNRYLGWYDGNPAHLHPLPPAEAGANYVEMMGGADEVVRKAREYFDRGDYRRVAQVLNHVVFADPTNQAARQLSADAMEQLGYQTESATWRNAYLSGASELRHGSLDLGNAMPHRTANAMDPVQVIDMAGVRFDPARFEGSATMVVRFTDLDETHLIGVEHAAIHQQADPPATVVAEADVRVALAKQTLIDLIYWADRHDGFLESGALAIEEGDGAVFRRFVDALDTFPTPRLIEPQPES
ncbi:MAG: alkyl sulfatase dimerization domain-containing protein [Acidimicrobiales bacterium]